MLGVCGERVVRGRGRECQGEWEEEGGGKERGIGGQQGLGMC